MADRSAIEWTDASWNPIRARATETGKVGWFCTHVSEGCRNCYAEGINARLGTQVDYKPAALKARPGEAAAVALFLDEAMLTQPLRWRRPRRIFVGSMTDLFADFVPDEWLDRVFAVMALSDHHTFQLLTKRPERARAYLTGVTGRIAAKWTRLREELAVSTPNLVRMGTAQWPLPHVWLGTSIEDQSTADVRIPELLATPAAVRWISAEPLLGPVDLSVVADNGCPNSWDGLMMDPTTGVYECCNACDYTGLSGEWGIDWVVAGGESGPGARPMHPDWIRQLRDQCAAAGVPFLFKQWGHFAPAFSGDNVTAASANIAWPDGTLRGGEAEERGGKGTAMIPLGKKAAGRLLDGALHDAWPEVR